MLWWANMSNPVIARYGWPVLAVVVLSSCLARPHRFQNLTVVPTTPVTVLPGTFDPSVKADFMTDSLKNRFSQAVEYNKRFTRLGNTSLFCESKCDSPDFLTVTSIASPAPGASPQLQNSFFLRMAERAQAVFVRESFARLPAKTTAADAISTLSKQLGDSEKPAEPASPIRPRVQLTISHWLSLPGDWERVQYLAVFFVLHSADVRFIDTNEFESVVRDIDLGKLTQTAVSSISGTASMGFGNALPAATAAPGNVSVTPSFSYTEALERQLKEQLQFRSSSIDSKGRVFCIVLKSSQTSFRP
jgi:hypothetical protein